MNRKQISEKIGARLEAILDRQGPYRMALLKPRHLQAIMDLHHLVIRQLSHKDMLQPFPEEFMREHMGEKGQIIGVFFKNRLVAFRNFYFPDPDDPEWNLGRDVGLSGEAVAQTANLQMVCVHPDHRGKSLALQMNSRVIRVLKELKTHRYLCATVSPLNVWNMKILLRCGFVIKNLKEKYSGKLRYIMFQDLENPPVFSADSRLSANLTDFHRQKRLLEKGYCGTRIRVITEYREPTDLEYLKGFEVVFRVSVGTTGRGNAQNAVPG